MPWGIFRDLDVAAEFGLDQSSAEQIATGAVGEIHRRIFAYSIEQFKLTPKRHRFYASSREEKTNQTAPMIIGMQYGLRGRSAVASFFQSSADLTACLSRLEAVMIRSRCKNAVIEIIAPAEDIVLPQGLTARLRHDAEVYVIDTHRDNIEKTYSKNHQRNIKKAVANSVIKMTNSSRNDVDTHASLWKNSMQRRNDAGEGVYESSDLAMIKAFTKNKLGYFVQLSLDDAIVTSSFIVEIGNVAHYYKSGTSTRGMEIGAAYLMIDLIIKDLRQRGIRYFNLGVSNQSRVGLSRFKAGFGAERTPIVKLYT